MLSKERHQTATGTHRTYKKKGEKVFREAPSSIKDQKG